jgi:hypothetical protein
MPLFDRATPPEALAALLDRECALLLEGRLSVFAQLAREKARLADNVMRAGAEIGDLQALRAKAERNQELLAQAAKGIAAARDRLAALRAGPAPMRTYCVDGTSIAMPAGGRKADVNHRA